MNEQIGMQGYDYDREDAWSAMGGGVRAHRSEAEQGQGTKPPGCADRHPDAISRRISRQQADRLGSIDDHCTLSPLTRDEIEAAGRGMSKVRQIRQEIREGLRNPDTGALNIVPPADDTDQPRLF